MLRQIGHHVTSTRDLGLTVATDDAQLLTAVQRRWILVTYNRLDFTLLHDAWLTWPAAFDLALPPHSGILVLDHASPDDQFGALETLLIETAERGFPNELYRWYRPEGWQRRL